MGSQGKKTSCTSPPFALSGPLLSAPGRSSKRQRLLVALQRSKSLRRSASRPAVGPPTRAIAGARGHHDHRAATVTPQLKRLMLTEMEDQPRAARSAVDEARELFL